MISDSDIGGAYVRRVFSHFGENLKLGQRLSREDVLSIRLANRRALIDAGYLEVWPRPPIEEVGDKIVVHRGYGNYDVFAQKLNSEHLSKEDAERLANG